MARLLRLLVLATALFGMIGGSTAIAMAQPPQLEQARQAHAPVAKPMAGMDCADMASERGRGSLPCKKLTLQCMAAMGCAATAALAPGDFRLAPVAIARLVPSSTLARRLPSRSPVPDPDPPSFLI